eukprot:43733-Chlamydomonas_euryale.AAC.9
MGADGVGTDGVDADCQRLALVAIGPYHCHASAGVAVVRTTGHKSQSPTHMGRAQARRPWLVWQW